MAPEWLVRIRVLGPLEVEVAGRPVVLPGRRPRRLLAALVVEAGRTVSMGALVDAVWGDAPPPSAVKTTQSYVARLRAALAPGSDPPQPVIVTTPSGYRLGVPPEAVDALVFTDRIGRARQVLRRDAAGPAERLLDEAFALWRGPPYGEFQDTGFGVAEAQRLQELRLIGLEMRLDAALLAGRDAEVIAEARGLCSAYPLQERFWARLMTALYRSGRQADALAAFQRVRRALADEVGADPGPELRRLEQQVLRHDPALNGPRRVPRGAAAPASPVDGTDRSAAGLESPAAPAVMRTLPACTAAFTGRAVDLGRLLDATREGGRHAPIVAIHAVDGMPGVGKTTLAVHAAHQLTDRFPDGQMFINLQAHTAGQRPVEPADALGMLLTAAGVAAANIPTGSDPRTVAEARSAMWRDRLAGRRVLLVLDNAAGYEQIAPLLPGPGRCLVLVTSRRRIEALTAVHGATALPLATLVPDAAAELFLRVAGRDIAAADADAVAALVGWCGCLPLAITVLAARWRHHPTWTVADLAADADMAYEGLRAGQTAVHATFALSYRDLPAGQRRLFRRLGLHPGTDIDVYAAAALAGTSLRATRRNLAALYDEHLVDEPARGRYRMHDLVRDYARALVRTEAERKAALTRLLTYYRHTTAAANARLDPDGRGHPSPQPAPPAAPALDTEDEALDWLRAELANLHACAAYAIAQGDHESVVGLSAAMALFLIRAGTAEQTIALGQAAVNAARLLGDPRVLANAYYHLGLGHTMADSWVESVHAYQQALALFRRIDDRPRQVDVLFEMGTVLRMMEDHTKAARSQKEALAIAREIGDRVGEANVLRELGTIRWALDDYPGALAALNAALEIAEATEDRDSQIMVRAGLVCLRLDIGDYAPAIELLTETAAAHHRARDINSEAETHRWLGIAYRRSGDLAAAARAQRRALRLYRSVGDSGQSPGAALNELGAVHIAAGDLPAAATALAEALTCVRSTGHRRHEAAVLNTTGTLLLLQGQPEEALAHHMRALERARQIHSPLEEARAHHGLARCALRTSPITDAIAHLELALALYRRIGVPEATETATELASLNARTRT